MAIQKVNLTKIISSCFSTCEGIQAIIGQMICKLIAAGLLISFIGYWLERIALALK